MGTPALLLAWAAAAFAAAGLTLGAGFTAGPDGGRGRQRMPVLALAAGGALAAALAALAAAALAGRGWWFAGEKLLVGLPLQAVGVAAAASGLVLWLRSAAVPLARTLLIGGGSAMLAAAASSWLVGFPPQPVATLVLAAAVVLATGLAWAVLTARGTRPVAGFAGMLALLLVAGVGWSWLSDTAAPRLEAGASHGHGSPAPPTADAVSVTDLRTPAEATGTVRRFDLTAGTHEVELASGETVEAWGFGGTGLAGPELRVQEGDLVEAHLANRDIEDGVTLHWHGYDVPNGEDGVAGVTQDAVAPGEGFTSRFVADQPGTYWYHTHQVSSEGVRRGLYGMFVVEPRGGIPETSDLALPIHRIGGEVVIGTTDGPQRVDAAVGESVRLRVANTEQSPVRVAVAGAPFRVVAVDGRDLAGVATSRAKRSGSAPGPGSTSWRPCPRPGSGSRPGCPRHPSSSSPRQGPPHPTRPAGSTTTPNSTCSRTAPAASPTSARRRCGPNSCSTGCRDSSAAPRRTPTP
ncbi:hypothetical protein GCM10025870_29860 [Agromyces marinus]|uniref:Plastocyanin-like domain-containing protein n=1 Tax=Agromyces marinus TaxID=1389020 RepID=A0ABM8H531_9MICO|nr:multicopper oxidase domain-containing protein [Agromyces marinus]BDZ55913.1 hypothetical protein GCM10025870_29860 [Agromyces marinus]